MFENLFGLDTAHQLLGRRARGMIFGTDVGATRRGLGCHHEGDDGTKPGGAAGEGGKAKAKAGDAGAGESGEGDEGGEGEGSGDDDDAPAISRKEQRKLIGQRDQHKLALRTVCDELGIALTWETVGGKRVPKFDGLDTLKEAREAAESAEDATAKKKGDWETRKTQLEQKHTARLTAAQKAAAQRETGLTALVQQLAVVEPLRAALAAEGAIDPFEEDPAKRGQYADYLKLMRDQLRVAVEIDEETGKATHVVEVLDDDGEPLADAKGQPVTLRAFVAKWLDTRKQNRKSGWRPGSGAGGFGGGGASGGGRQSGSNGNGGGLPKSPTEAAKAAAVRTFGEAGLSLSW